MAKKNCWEFMQCGREPGGVNAAKLGECVACTTKAANDIHGGQNAGRACWAIAGTLCGGSVQGSFATKLETCKHCNFYKQVFTEEGQEFLLVIDILARVKKRT